jgi:hypothetical protein
MRKMTKVIGSITNLIYDARWPYQKNLQRQTIPTVNKTTDSRTTMIYFELITLRRKFALTNRLV